MKKILSIIAISLFLVSCGEQAANNQRNNTNANNAANREQEKSANTNTEKSADTGFELPTAKPVENGKSQSLTGIAVTVPADWKKVDAKEGWIKFQSPDKIELIIQRMYDLQPRDMMGEFILLRKENPNYKAMMRAIDGELGILYLNENSSVMNGDVLTWMTFPPPDAKGFAVTRMVTLVCPAGTYEQNKQIMFDILFSTKLKA